MTNSGPGRTELIVLSRSVVGVPRILEISQMSAVTKEVIESARVSVVVGIK
jgi:hypothetical protein